MFTSGPPTAQSRTDDSLVGQNALTFELWMTSWCRAKSKAWAFPCYIAEPRQNQWQIKLLFLPWRLMHSNVCDDGCRPVFLFNGQKPLTANRKEECAKRRVAGVLSLGKFIGLGSFISSSKSQSPIRAPAYRFSRSNGAGRAGQGERERRREAETDTRRKQVAARQHPPTRTHLDIDGKGKLDDWPVDFCPVH